MTTADYRNPEDVAPELGIKPTTLRRLCRQTGICTRLERGRITLDADDIARMRQHIKAHGTRAVSEPDEVDYFAA